MVHLELGANVGVSHLWGYLELLRRDMRLFPKIRAPPFWEAIITRALLSGIPSQGP